ncbi:MAG: hypothetical protein ASARMPRED_008237 [Alectoria sarmentosa]|nr:MAG: hypothetical protein ASARMPRED_008237 [Alectoria sarmentosa]
MADPVSTAASVAGFVGLADVALRASKELYIFFDGLNDATKEIKLLSTELKDVNDVLSEIRTFASDYEISLFGAKDLLKIQGLSSTLHACEENVAEVKRKLKPMESSIGGAEVKRLANSFQWVFMKDRFKGHQQELGRHKETLHIMLSVCGRRNDIQIRKQTHSLQQSLYGFRTSTLRQYQALETGLREGSRDSEKMLDTIKGLEISHAHGLEAVQASVTAKTGLLHDDSISTQQEIQTAMDTTSFKLDSIHQQISQANLGASKALKTAKQGVLHDQMRQNYFLKKQRIMYLQMAQKMDQLVSCITPMSLGHREQNGWDVHVQKAGVESTMMPLLLMKSPLQKALSTLVSAKGPGDLINGHVNLIWSEFTALLASSHEAASHLAKDQSLGSFGQTKVPRLHQSYHHKPSKGDAWCAVRKNGWLDGKDFTSVAARTERQCPRTSIAQRTPEGILLLESHPPPREDMDQNSSLEISFFPCVGICKTGIAARFEGSVRESRQLRTFDKVCKIEDNGLGLWATDDGLGFEILLLTDL